MEGVADTDPDRRAQAAARLAAIYMPAILATLLAQGVRSEEARELAQAFYVEVVLARGLMERARRGGSLRGYIKASLANYRASQFRRAQSRGGPHARLEADPPTHNPETSDPSAHPPPPPPPSPLASSPMWPDGIGGHSAVDPFDRAWATELLAQALARAEAYLRAHGLERHWELFLRCRLHPAIHNTTAPSAQTAALELGFAKPADASAALHYATGRVRRLLGELLAEAGCDGPADQAAVLAALGQGLHTSDGRASDNLHHP